MLLKLLILTIAVLIVTAQENLTPYGIANQSSVFYGKGNPENAIHPPKSNAFSLDNCSHTETKEKNLSENKTAWWMFSFPVDTLYYITDIAIYYRVSYANRMKGFKVYVSNTSKIPPDSYLCYKDPGPDLPVITQSIPCYQLGQYVIYYDEIGSDSNDSNYGPIVELCYVAINGCSKTFWGKTCSQSCSKHCLNQHCFPGNGSCVWGCNCPGICNVLCLLDGCEENRTGLSCNKYNLASAGSVSQNINNSQPSIQVNDGNFSSCSSIEGSNTWIQIDIQEISIVTEIYFIIAGNNTQEGNHTIYASNSSGFIGNVTIIYMNEYLPSEIKINAVFRYLIYAPPIQSNISEICEIGIAGEGYRLQKN